MQTRVKWALLVLFVTPGVDRCDCGLFQSKSGSMVPNTPFPPKKEIVFPPDSVEAVQPTLTKRRRLTHKDLGRLGALLLGVLCHQARNDTMQDFLLLTPVNFLFRSCNSNQRFDSLCGVCL